MRWLVAVMLVGGCAADRTLPAVDWGTQPKWTAFADFEIQIYAQAPGLAWSEAEQSCNAISTTAHLPTEQQWDVVRVAQYKGIESPDKEWFWNKDAKSAWYYAAISTYLFDPPTIPVAFRCARQLTMTK